MTECKHLTPKQVKDAIAKIEYSPTFILKGLDYFIKPMKNGKVRLELQIHHMKHFEDEMKFRAVKIGDFETMDQAIFKAERLMKQVQLVKEVPTKKSFA